MQKILHKACYLIVFLITLFVNCFAINATYYLEQDNPIVLDSSILNLKYTNSQREDWFLRFYANKDQLNSYVEVVYYDFNFDQSLPPFQVWQILNKSRDYKNYKLTGKTSRILLESSDFDVTFCSLSINDNSYLIVSQFNTSCGRKIEHMDTGSVNITLTNPTIRCVWMIESEGEPLSMNFTSRNRLIGNSNNQLYLIETDPINTKSQSISLDSKLSIIMESNLVVIEFIPEDEYVLQEIFFQFQTLDHQSMHISEGRVKITNVEYSCVCGRANIEQRIVGGFEVNPSHKYPWMVAFLNRQGKPFCSGSIISRHYILTAAHCFDSISTNYSLISSIKVALGVQRLNETGLKEEIESILIHPKYHKTSQALFNDLALVKLKQRLVFNINRRPICLPNRSMNNYRNLTVAGWGFTVEDGFPSQVLREVSLPFVENHVCADFHGDSITDDMICAGGQKDQDSCHGDSGSPLMHWQYGHAFVVGIVSYGLGCGRPSYYGVNTRVQSYLEWIYANTQDSTYCARPPRIVSAESSSSNNSSKESSQSMTTTSTIRPTTIRTSTTTGASTSTEESGYFKFDKPINVSMAYPLSLNGLIPFSTFNMFDQLTPLFPNLIYCGISNTPNSRIIGGQEVQPQAFPWMASISYQNLLVGGGVLISSNYILTSGTRLKYLTQTWSFNKENLRIVLGAYDLSNVDEKKQVFKVDKIFIHPYNGLYASYNYDFALIRLALNPDQSMTDFNSICLPKSTFKIMDGISGLGTGWGTISNEVWQPSVRLRKVKLDLITAKTCRYFYPNSISDAMFCAAKPSSDMCLGDNGGPLMFPYQRRWYLIGIYSWSPSGSCAVPNRPSVFADIRKALPWISIVTGLVTV